MGKKKRQREQEDREDREKMWKKLKDLEGLVRLSIEASTTKAQPSCLPVLDLTANDGVKNSLPNNGELFSFGDELTLGGETYRTSFGY